MANALVTLRWYTRGFRKHPQYSKIPSSPRHYSRPGFLPYAYQRFQYVRYFVNSCCASLIISWYSFLLSPRARVKCGPKEFIAVTMFCHVRRGRRRKRYKRRCSIRGTAEGFTRTYFGWRCGDLFGTPSERHWQMILDYVNQACSFEGPAKGEGVVRINATHL